VANLKCLGLVEVVLGSEADHGDFVGVLSSKLLDAGGFPVTGRSMWSPKPDEHRFAPIEKRGKCYRLSRLDIGDVHDRQGIACGHAG
jgi:hypothetical protein